MLRNVNSLLGVSILAKDGNIGHVVDVLFDDHSWIFRYFCVCQLDLAPFDALIWPHLVFA
jgi:hypothetical protein